MRQHGRTIEAQWRASPRVHAHRNVAPKRTFGDFLNYLWSLAWTR